MYLVSLMIPAFQSGFITLENDWIAYTNEDIKIDLKDIDKH